MATTDFSVQLRRAILPVLKADAKIAAAVGGRVYSETPTAIPAWPFIRFGFAIGTPEEWSCAEGANVSFTVNVFSKAAGTDECARIVRLVCAALDERQIALEVDADTGKQSGAYLSVTRTQIMRDGDEADAHHGAISFDAMVSG